MEILADAMPDKAAIPRSTDGMVDIQSLLRLLAEQVVNAIMDEEADQLCSDGANSRNGYRNRTLETCVGTLNLSDLCQDFGHASSRNQAAIGMASGLGSVLSKKAAMASAGTL